VKREFSFSSREPTDNLVGLYVEEVLSGTTYKIIKEDGFSVCLSPVAGETTQLKQRWVSIEKLGSEYQLEVLDSAGVSDGIREMFCSS
jgi:hypothetical protein